MLSLSKGIRWDETTCRNPLKANLNELRNHSIEYCTALSSGLLLLSKDLRKLYVDAKHQS